MKSFHGTDSALEGFYLNTRQLSFTVLEKADQLPGVETDRYLRVPPLAMLVVGPLLGLAYVIFLPVIGFVMLGSLIVSKMADLTVSLGGFLARVLSPAWQPALAFFAHRKKTDQVTKDEWSSKVSEELDEKNDRA